MSVRKNNEQCYEALSALVDNEVSELELHRILKDVADDDTARATWSRYQVISSVMRGDKVAATKADFSLGVMSAIADEPAYADSVKSGKVNETKKVGFWGNLGRFAVAASVAGAVVISVQQLQSGATVGQDAVIASSTDSSSSPVADLPMGLLAPDFPSVRNVSAGSLKQSPGNHSAQKQPVIMIPVQGSGASPELQAYLNGLMLQHAEHTANAGAGMLPFARIPRIDQALESARLTPETSDNSGQSSTVSGQ